MFAYSRVYTYIYIDVYIYIYMRTALTSVVYVSYIIGG